jgi:hypothetical protein
MHYLRYARRAPELLLYWICRESAVRSNYGLDNSVNTTQSDDMPQSSEQAASATAADATQTPTRAKLLASRGQRLAKLAGVHGLVLLAALVMFAAADSWHVVTGLGLASFLSVITAVLAGVTTATLVHEWFHYFGARYAIGKFDIPATPGLFVFNWDFANNSVRQFLIMSVAGSVGGVLSVLLLWHAVPADSIGRAALRSAAIASVIYSAMIEWPVISRVRAGGEPLAELSKIDKQLLTRSFIVAGVAIIVLTLFFSP